MCLLALGPGEQVLRSQLPDHFQEEGPAVWTGSTIRRLKCIHGEDTFQKINEKRTYSYGVSQTLSGLSSVPSVAKYLLSTDHVPDSAPFRERQEGIQCVSSHFTCRSCSPDGLDIHCGEKWAQVETTPASQGQVAREKLPGSEPRYPRVPSQVAIPECFISDFCDPDKHP